MDIKHASFADPSNHVRTLEAGSGQKAILTFSEKTSEVSAFLVSNNGVSKAVANENLPKDFQMIKSLDSFNGFLENAQARGTVLSDGEAKLYVMQKGVGGADKEKGKTDVSANPKGSGIEVCAKHTTPNGNTAEVCIKQNIDWKGGGNIGKGSSEIRGGFKIPF